MPLAVDFSPRTKRQVDPSRSDGRIGKFTFLENELQPSLRDARRETAIFRGLKPTARFNSSLRDEVAAFLR